MSNELTTFTFAPTNTQVRVVTINGNPWFAAADVCRVLGLDTTKVARTVGPDEKGLHLMPTLGGNQRLVCVTESGLYKLIMRSDKPEARKFQDWVTREVLPAIRKDGAYIMGEEKVRTGEMDEDELVLRAVSILQKKVERLREEKAKLEAENTSMGEVIGAHMHTVARFARAIPGVNTNAIKRDLLREGYLYKQGGTYRVYRKFADCFVEKLNEQYGKVDIYVTENGKLLLLGLNRLGKLTRLKSACAD